MLMTQTLSSSLLTTAELQNLQRQTLQFQARQRKAVARAVGCGDEGTASIAIDAVRVAHRILHILIAEH